jgi:hypothetical protein
VRCTIRVLLLVDLVGGEGSDVGPSVCVSLSVLVLLVCGGVSLPHGTYRGKTGFKAIRL